MRATFKHLVPPVPLHSIRAQPNAHALVIVVRGAHLVLWRKDEEDVGVGEAALLELNDVAIRGQAAQHFVLDQVCHQLFQLEVENAGQQVSTVVGMLAREQLILHLLWGRSGGIGVQKLACPGGDRAQRRAEG